MGDMGEIFNAMRQHDKERRERNLKAADPTGWTIHTDVHWSRDLAGSRLDYWPSRNKFRWKGKTHCGDVQGFIHNREPAQAMEARSGETRSGSTEGDSAVAKPCAQDPSGSNRHG